MSGTVAPRPVLKFSTEGGIRCGLVRLPRWTLWTFAAVLLLTGYLLSPVPLGDMADRLGLNSQPAFYGFVHIVYFPLELLYETVPAVKQFYDAYFEFGQRLLDQSA